MGFHKVRNPVNFKWGVLRTLTAQLKKSLSWHCFLENIGQFKKSLISYFSNKVKIK